MKQYQNPTLTLLALDEQDVIRTSVQASEDGYVMNGDNGVIGWNVLQ